MCGLKWSGAPLTAADKALPAVRRFPGQHLGLQLVRCQKLDDIGARLIRIWSDILPQPDLFELQSRCEQMRSQTSLRQSIAAAERACATRRSAIHFRTGDEHACPSERIPMQLAPGHRRERSFSGTRFPPLAATLRPPCSSSRAHPAPSEPVPVKTTRARSPGSSPARPTAVAPADQPIVAGATPSSAADSMYGSLELESND